MWDEMQQFLESLLANYGIIRVLLGPFAVIAVFAGVGLIGGGDAAIVGVALSLFVAVAIIIALTMQLRSTRELLNERARIVNLYTERFILGESESYSIEDWDESVTIARNGDTKLEKWVTVRVGDGPLYSVWSSIQPAGIAPADNISKSVRRRVKFEARSFSIRNDFHITPYEDCRTPSQSRTPDDTLVVRWEHLGVPLGVKVGFRLDGRELRR